VTDTGEYRLRAGVIGFALAAGVAGLLHAISNLAVGIVVDRLVDPGYLGDRWLTSFALILLGVAGLLAWTSRAGSRVAAGLTVLSAGCLAVAGVKAAEPFVQGLPYGVWAPDLLRGVATVVPVALVLGAAWAWVRHPQGPVRLVPALLGAVVGLAVPGVPSLVQQVALLVRSDPRLGDPSTGQLMPGILAAAVLVLAAVLAVLALAGRVPVAVAAAAVLAAAVLFAVVTVRDLDLLRDVLSYGSTRMRASVVVSLVGLAVQVLVTLALGIALLVGGRTRAAAVAEAPDATYPPPA